MFANSNPSGGSIEDHREVMKRAKWALFEYMSKETA